MAKIISPDGTKSYIVRPGVNVRDVKDSVPELKDVMFSVKDSDGTFRSLNDNDYIPDNGVVLAVESHKAGRK